MGREGRKERGRRWREGVWRLDLRKGREKKREVEESEEEEVECGESGEMTG